MEVRTMKRRTLWISLVVLLIAAAAGAAVVRKPAPVVTVAAAPSALEFLPSDLTLVGAHDLRQLIALSGALRAVNQAAVKAKVAGEVREVLVREGETVKAGQVLVRMDTNEYASRAGQANGALLAARGQLDIAAKARDNNQALVAKGFISQNAFENAASQFDIARANVASAQSTLDVARKLLDDTTVRAPISGVVSSRSVQPGEKVSVDFRLLDVVDLQRMELEAAVPTTDIVNISVGQEVQVRVEGLSKSLAGKVVRINPATQAGSRSILAYIEVDNAQRLLRSGMFGEAQLTLSKKAGVLTAPQSAIQSDGGRTYVYAIENNQLVQKPVTLGVRGNDGDRDAVEVVSGLASGAQIVKSNMGNLRPGTPVKLIKGS
ncbi:MAG: efflux RND transporter periplasmic adaptor subunit [Herminiimonas sp.]|nr:efflux RND transporter periplasmic adaptor subunit [Herminiimonas sp.]